MAFLGGEGYGKMIRSCFILLNVFLFFFVSVSFCKGGGLVRGLTGGNIVFMI